MVYPHTVKNVDLTPLSKAGHEFLQLVQPLFAEHAFLTIICAFFAVTITLSFYRFLKSISPGLVAFIMILVLGILVLHWTITRTEPAVLKPVIDQIAPFFPSAPTYPPGKPIPAKSAPARAKP
jgi:predicted PurR-regulated permease PerM